MFDHPHGILTVEDNIDSNAYCLIKYILSKLKSSQTTAICVEKKTNHWNQILENITTISCDNPKNWHSTIKQLQTTEYKVKTTLIIDSINQLSALCNWDSCLEVLGNLRRNTLVSVVVILHNDCLLNSSMVKHLKYLSQTYIILNSVVDKYNLKITNVLMNGKVKSSSEQLVYDFETKTWKKSDIKKVTENTNKEKLPEDLASFKISVDDEAKKVKNNMILPYTELDKAPSKIIYYNDAADDWDDEDPDDDLDI